MINPKSVIERCLRQTENFFEDNPQYNWFLRIDIKNSIIYIHPQGGKEDHEKDLSRVAATPPEFINRLETEQSLWYGPLKSLSSAIGFARQMSQIYEAESFSQMPVRFGYVRDYDWSSINIPIV